MKQTMNLEKFNNDIAVIKSLLGNLCILMNDNCIPSDEASKIHIECIKAVLDGEDMYETMADVYDYTISFWLKEVTAHVYIVETFKVIRKLSSIWVANSQGLIKHES